MHKWLFLLIAVVICVSTAVAQDVEPQRVEVQAEDGLTLVGDFYMLSEEQAPVVMLIHGGAPEARHTWDPLVQPLLDARYQVLAVDSRSFGETGGEFSLSAGQTDTLTWLTWLREQPTVRDDAISPMGASTGSSWALVGCAQDELCVTAILLSPANLPLVEEDDALVLMENRSMLVINGDGDLESFSRLRRIVQLAQGDIGVRIYRTPYHGTDLFADEVIAASLTSLVISWLDEHTPEVE